MSGSEVINPSDLEAKKCQFICRRTYVPLACVAGVQKGRGSELGRETARERGGKSGRSKEVPFLSPSRSQIPLSPSLFNACHTG